jgi:hypothetical protein
MRLNPKTSCFRAVPVGVTPFAQLIVWATVSIWTALIILGVAGAALCERMTVGVRILLLGVVGTFVKFAVMSPVGPLA